MAASTTVLDRTDGNRRDTDLVMRAQAWDPDAQVALFVKYHAVFHSWVRRRFYGRQWHDVYTDTATSKVFEELHKYDPERSAFCSWAHSVAKKAIFQFIRDNKSERNDPSLDGMWEDALTALSGPEEEYVFRRVYEEVARLGLEQRVAVGGPYLDGYSDEELADGLHIPRRRVCYRRKQAMAALRRRLSHLSRKSIRPERRFSGYYTRMDDEGNADESTQPGGEGGDS